MADSEGMEVELEQLFLPQVSVVVPIYNGEADLPDLLDCLLRQTYPSDRVDYLLVDNGSCDRTSLLLQEAVTAASTQGIVLHPLSEPNIQSSYAARNAGIRATNSPILAFTDADCRPQPDWLQSLVQPFQDPKIGVVVGEISALPGNTLLEQHAEREQTLSQKHTLSHSFYPYGQTANLALHRQILEQVGLFRPYLTTGGDADLCWRIQQQTDWQLHFAERAIVRHRHRTTLQQLQSQWRRYGRSNRYLHELHQVPLMPELSGPDYLRRWGRWLLKEVPQVGLNAIAGKATWLDLLSTPIGLFTNRARIIGQQQANLPEQARKIEWLP